MDSQFLGFRILPSLLGFLLASSAIVTPSAQAISALVQKTVPEDVSEIEAAILENNDAFVTFMTERAVRTVSKDAIEIVKNAADDDREFIRENREKNGDYWYWAHQKARDALILALGGAAEEAVRAIDLIPYSEALIAEYRWITEPEFRAYLEKAGEDILYYYDPYIAIEVFLTNYQVSKLDRNYPSTAIAGGRTFQPQIPILAISIQKLVATPRPGEEGEVGLDAILNLPGGGVTEPLIPGSEEFLERTPPINDKLITAADFQRKTIPVGTRDAEDLLEPLMAEGRKFLMIQGSMRTSRDSGTSFSEDLMIVLNPESALATFLEMHRGAFADTNVNRAQ